MAIKRVIDIVVAGAGLVVLAPALLLIGLVLFMSMGRPILFRQRRPGLGGRPFELVKFRTMANSKDGRHDPAFDAQRLTPLGSWLRNTSLDELPELWNVLRGEMSLVGPRPLLMQYLDRYTPEQARRHLVRPGLTGLAQVSGRNALDWEQKFALDIWYVDHRTLWLDIKILGMTVARLLRPSGIAAEGEASMPEFFGSKPSAVEWDGEPR